MYPVVHFELPANDRERSKKFYETAFDWKTSDLGPAMNNYITVETSPTEPSGFPEKRGMINGGIYTKTPDMPAQFPSMVLGVDDIRKVMEKVTAAGGTVLGEPMDIPGVGQYVAFMDTEGNRLSLMQPTTPMAQ